MNQESKVAELSELWGIYISYCQMCKVWHVNCPHGCNFCGYGCDCGYQEFLENKQQELDSILGQ